MVLVPCFINLCAFSEIVAGHHLEQDYDKMDLFLPP